MEMLFDTLGSSIRISMPLILAALGGMFCERAGVLNIGLEGIMLLGAFFGVLGSYYSSSAFTGLLFTIAIGGIIGFFHGYLTVRKRTSHIINGVAINLLGEGLTIMLLVLIWGNKGKSTEVAGFKTLASTTEVPIPVISDILGNVTGLFHFMILLVIFSYIYIYFTPLGLRLRVIGDKPEAADTLGVNVERSQILYVVFGSILASIAGASLTIGDIHYFSRGITAGRGFMALAAMVFGLWRPGWILLGGLFFGLIQSLQMRLQIFDVPVQFIQMIPYLMTIFMLSFTSKSNKSPQNAGKHFIRGVRNG